MMEETEDQSPPQKKALIVNLSSLHELNYPITVLNKLARLHPSYPSNLPALMWKLLNGQFNGIINNYKLGRINTIEFRNQVVNALDLSNVPSQNIDDAWNALIDFKDGPPGCCFWACHALSCKQKFTTLQLICTQVEIDKLYFISNTNPLHVKKIVAYLKEKFYGLIIDNAKDIVNNSENQSNKPNKSNENQQNKDIKISLPHISPEIYLTLSYRYGLHKTGTQNLVTTEKTGLLGQISEISPPALPSTPALLLILKENLDREKIKIIGVVSQFPGDCKQAETLGIPAYSAQTFYNEKDVGDKMSYQKETSSSLEMR